MPTNPFNVPEIETALGQRYVVGAEVRVGGQGVVYRAMRVRDLQGNSCHNDVALKLQLDWRQDERAEREIRAAHNLRHATLATLLEDGTVLWRGNDILYVAWDFIEGEALDARLLRGPLSERETLHIMQDVISAITILWSRRIVHRDIAPKNIMVKPNGRAVVIDLGGARHLDASTITAPGATFGTPGYFSPEQCRAEHALTNASDIFTLGVVTLECLLGHHPTHLDQRRLISVAMPVDALVPNASKELRKIIEGMLQLRAAFRPRVAELQARVRALLT